MGRRRPFVALVASTWISTIGSAITLIALPWFVLDTTGSGARTGLVATMETMGLVASVALAGPLIDRYGARRIAIIADLTAASAVAGVPILHGTLGLPYPDPSVEGERAPARAARESR